MRSALIWQELEKGGCSGRDWCSGAMRRGGSRLLTIVSIKQRYPGHARPSRDDRRILSCWRLPWPLQPSSSTMTSIVTNTNDVLWALTTRSNPEIDIEIIRRSWSGSLDPIISHGHRRGAQFRGPSLMPAGPTNG